MPFDCKVGDVAHIYDWGGGHWYVVLTTPNKNGKVVRVNFTSSRGQVDGGRVFTPSDNKSLFEFPSIVPYRRAQIYPCGAFRDEANRSDVLNKYKFCPHDIMEQIIEDAFKSQHTKGDVIEELKTQYPKEYNLSYEDYAD